MEIINKSVSQFVVLKYLTGQRFPGLLLRDFCCKFHRKCLCVHLCPPASVDERADRLVRPRSTGVEVGAVPRFYHPHKVGTFTLDKDGQRQVEFKHHRRHCPVLKAACLDSERAGCKHTIPPVFPFLSSDIPPFFLQTPASGSVFSEKNKTHRVINNRCMWGLNRIADWI